MKLLTVLGGHSFGRRSTDTHRTDFLLPADIDEILEVYGYYLQSYTQLKDKESIFANFKRTTKRLEVLFPLIVHPVHGITGLHAVENYNKAGYTRQYQWKTIVPKMGIQMSHISGWGNDPHDAEWPPKNIK